jgi:hypothetical protein
MVVNVIKSMPVILPVALLTGLLTLVVPGMLDKGVSRGSGALGWLVGSAIFGVIVVAVYQWVGGRWPGMEAAIFFKLGIYTFIGFTLLAIVVLPLLKMPLRIPVYTLMHLIWAAGYGYFLPQLLK